MASTVREVMSVDPVSLRSDAPIIDAAKVMQSADIGDVMVNDGKGICGIVTDRDVVVRAIAQGRDPATTPLERDLQPRAGDGVARDSDRSRH